MHFEGTFYSGIDFTKLHEISDPILESIHTRIKYEIANLQTKKSRMSMYIMNMNRLKTQLRLVEEEMAERILLGDSTENTEPNR